MARAGRGDAPGGYTSYEPHGLVLFFLSYSITAAFRLYGGRTFFLLRQEESSQRRRRPEVGARFAVSLCYSTVGAAG